MKNLNLPVILAAITILSLSSCVKQMDAVPSPVATSAAVEKFSDISASGNFNWSTTNKIRFSFSGLSGNEYRLVLKVADSAGHVLFQKLQNANENYLEVLEVPADLETVTVSFGATSQQFTCSSGAIVFSID